MRLVIIESPYAATATHTVEDHLRYARACMADCLARGEAPFASHLLYTQPGILDDTKPEERKLGMDAGFAWRRQDTKTVLYVDLGISKGMMAGILDAQVEGSEMEFRTLGPRWDDETIDLASEVLDDVG